MVNTTAFKRYVEVGRVVLINKGQDEGKLATIVDIIDQNRAIIDGPSIDRQPFAYRYVTLTPYVVQGLPRAAGTKTVNKFFEKSEIASKWENSAWAKKRAAVLAKKATTDFQRFEIMTLKKQRRRILGAAIKKAGKA